MTKENDPYIASSTSTGGGGTFFEQAVNAFWLTLLLTRALPPVQPLCQVAEVHFQTNLQGWHTDDFLLVGTDKQGMSKLLGQVKRTLTVSDKDSEFVKVIQDAWSDFNNTLFDADRDNFLLAVCNGSKVLLTDFAALLEHARASSEAVEFYKKISTPRFVNKNTSLHLGHIQRIVKDLTDDVTAEKIWCFIRRLHVISFDFGHTGNLAEAQAKSLLKLTAVEQCPSQLERGRSRR